jgi:hypothetical protein
MRQDAGQRSRAGRGNGLRGWDVIGDVEPDLEQILLGLRRERNLGPSGVVSIIFGLAALALDGFDVEGPALAPIKGIEPFAEVVTQAFELRGLHVSRSSSRRRASRMTSLAEWYRPLSSLR